MEKDKINLTPKSPISDFNSKFLYAWETEHRERQLMVEHYIINWSIESLKLLLPQKNGSISSPDFLLDSSKTTWFIEMHPSNFYDKEKITYLHLHRPGKEGPPAVGITFRFGLSMPDGSETWLKQVKVPEFECASSFRINVTADEWAPLSKHLKEYEKKIVVLCELYVTFEVSRCRFDRLLGPSDIDLVNFSFDFAKMLSATESADYSVTVPSVELRTHKVILAARSSVFENIIKNDEYKNGVKFEDISAENMRGIFFFMYSGNISLTLRRYPPCIGFYECAKKFEVSELIALLYPKLLIVRTVLKIQEIRYTWFINNFNQLSATDIVSPEFSSSAANAPKWKLTLNFSSTFDQIAIFAEADKRNNITGDVLVKISLIDRNDQITKTQVTTQFIDHKTKCVFSSFLNMFSVQNEKLGLVNENILTVYCELQFVEPLPFIEIQNIYTAGKTTFLDACRNLSNDFSKLLDKPELSDVSIETSDGLLISVHKSILFARSRNFYSKFLYYNKNQSVIKVFDVHPDIVRLMIHHAYSGILNSMSTGDLFRLHEAAEKYVFRHLTLMTMDNLAAQISPENLFDFYKETVKLKHLYLKTKCESFVRENSETLVEMGNWEEWRSQDVELCEKLANCLIKRFKSY